MHRLFGRRGGFRESDQTKPTIERPTVTAVAWAAVSQNTDRLTEPSGSPILNAVRSLSEPLAGARWFRAVSATIDAQTSKRGGARHEIGNALEQLGSFSCRQLPWGRPFKTIGPSRPRSRR